MGSPCSDIGVGDPVVRRARSHGARAGLKSTAKALYLRDHVLEQLELADVDDDAGRAVARRTIVVVGASYSGTELVLQLRALTDSATNR